MDPQQDHDENFQRCREWICARAAGPRDGIFGPKSAMWLIMREMAIPFGSLGAVLLQVAHPSIAAAGAHGSRVRSDFTGRTKRTFSAVCEIIFGDLDTALATIDRIHRIHSKIKGTVEADGASRKYRATDPGLLFWVLATLIDGSIQLYELVVGPLSLKDREDYFQDMKTLGVAMGIPPESMPEDWQAFTRYFETMIQGDQLMVGPVGRRLASFILDQPLARWTPGAALATGLLPQRWREAYGLPWATRQQFCFSRLIACMRFVMRQLPASLRFSPAYHQALVRTGGAPRQSKTAGTRAIAKCCELLHLPFYLNSQPA